MKLIRIGNSQQCDLRLDSEYVSALHAELTILDDGQIILEDKNSKNGTTVGNKKLEPGKEVTIQRGDMVTFADTQLVWARVPAAEKLDKYKAVFNIGSNYRNDIILNSQTVSRYHASIRIGKDGKLYIHDNGSRNGTMVNGVKISPHKDERIKRGDNIVCGTEDITEQVLSLLPKMNLGKILGITGAALALAAVIIGAIFILWPKKKVIDPTIYRPTVVYVRTIWHPIVKFEDNPMPGEWNGEITIGGSYLAQATAFFLDTLGRMGTNRHVALPWEQLSTKEQESIRDYIEDNLPKGNNIDNFLNSSIFSNEVVKYALSKSGNNRDRFIKNVLNYTSRISKSKYTITGKIEHITVGYPGNYYTHEDEFQRCNVLKASDNKDIDLAILQLNNKTTPKNIKTLFNPKVFYTERLKPLEDNLFTIGYPAGLLWSQEDNTKSLEPSIRETKCSKEPGKYDFEFQANSVGGSSGSPVFNKYGDLVGVLYGGWQVAGGSTKAVHAKFLKDMYDEEIKLTGK